METELNKLIRQQVFDMICIVFVGHGFGKGPGYLKGVDMKVLEKYFVKKRVAIIMPKMSFQNNVVYSNGRYNVVRMNRNNVKI
jgi:hypothetical protein